MLKRILGMFLVMAIVLPLAACGEGGELPSAEEIVGGVIEALDDVKTYEFDVDMSMDMAGEAEAFETTIEMALRGALDIENKEMRAEIAMNVAMPEEEEMDVAMEMYLVGDEMYMMMDVPDTGPMWMKQDVQEGLWEETVGGMSLAESQIEFLETGEVKVTGSEKVEGVDCWVLEIRPDMEHLWELAMGQAEVPGDLAGFTEALDEDALAEIFRDFSMKQWIAKDTYFLMKAGVAMDMELSPEVLGYPEEEGAVAMEMAMSFLAYNYNQPVSIVLPPEAEEAIEVPGE